MFQYRTPGFRILPPVVKNLLIINGLAYLITYVLKLRFQVNLEEYLGLYPVQSPKFHFYQVITHVFMHGNLAHIFSNMLALWMFGSVIENYWGPKRFVVYYFFTALGAALLHEAVNAIEIYHIQDSIAAFTTNPSLENFDKVSVPEVIKRLPEYGMVRTELANGPLIGQAQEIVNEIFNITLERKLNSLAVGASGAVFGILIAFGMLFPNTLIYIYFAIPVKAKWVVLAYGLFELMRGFQNDPGDNVAHFAHLGGMLFGFILVKYWNKNIRNRFY